MSQNEKDILLEKFLARALSGAEKTAFEDLVRTDKPFAKEVALRLAEADAFHRAHVAEKADIERRYRRRRWLRWAVWSTIGLLGLFGITKGCGDDKMTNSSRSGGGGPVQPHDNITRLDTNGAVDTSFNPLYTSESASSTEASDDPTENKLLNPCIRDTSWMHFIDKDPVAGGSNDWQSLLAVGKYQEALRVATAFISQHQNDFADYPYDCLGCGALNLCMPDGDIELAIQCLEVAQNHVNYKSKNVAVLLVLAYACKNECEKANKLVQKEKIGQLLDDEDLKVWLSKCGDSKR
ncbi:MAG TPA: hypothetical protein PK228_15070 [Saprospiraceae bacterium]|nr:hypothetical protein [Saprospiraceae bacterium]